MVIHELTLSFHVDEMSKKVSLLKKPGKLLSKCFFLSSFSDKILAGLEVTA